MRKMGYVAEVSSVFAPGRKVSALKAADNLDLPSDIPKDLEFDPNFVYSTVRAISARVNLNCDGFRREEILGAVEGHEPHNEKFGYRTFIGKNNHIDHFNEPSLASVEPLHTPLGKILWASYHEDDLSGPVMMEGFPDPAASSLEDPIVNLAGRDCWVKLLIANDRRERPRLCAAIEEGFLTKVSMGAEILYSTCSVCGNVARTESHFCRHARFGRGQVYAAQKGSPLVRMGAIEPGDPVLAFEDNHGLQFFEISWITDVQADPTAEVLGLIRSDLVEGGDPSEDLEAIRRAASLSRVAEESSRPREEDPKVNLHIENLPEEETEREMDYTRPPNEQGGGPFAPEYPFPCSARYSAARANPDYPIDQTIDVDLCMGCKYNLDDRAGYVDCRFPKVVREGGSDPLPPGFEPPEHAEERSDSGFVDEDGSPIEEFPGLEKPPR